MAPRHRDRLDQLSDLGVTPGAVLTLRQRKPSLVVEVDRTLLALEDEIADGNLPASPRGVVSDGERDRTLWRAFEDNEITIPARTTFSPSRPWRRLGLTPRAADVARQLSVTRSAASLQLRTLQERGLVKLDSRQRLSLTRLGADLVARVASKRDIFAGVPCAR